MTRESAVSKSDWKNESNISESIAYARDHLTSHLAHSVDQAQVQVLVDEIRPGILEALRAQKKVVQIQQDSAEEGYSPMEPKDWIPAGLIIKTLGWDLKTMTSEQKMAIHEILTGSDVGGRIFSETGRPVFYLKAEVSSDEDTSEGSRKIADVLWDELFGDEDVG